MKKVLVGAGAAVLFFAGVGTAAADAWHHLPAMAPQGVYFSDGKYQFNPPERNHGAFEWKGQLTDALPNDGHNVYMLARAEGHGWSRYNGKQRRTVYMHQSNWDGAQRYTNDAEIRACRDRGSLRPDNCSPTLAYHGPKWN
ncbi:hypothetical protein ACIBBD_03085 [Streptomyces sp. NPDC051315]|uniref:hypothetical protein n=1 Tax=Streptomyces sp. NPDC051315 TaxID=3365650 RepID=UPI0037909FE4